MVEMREQLVIGNVVRKTRVEIIDAEEESADKPILYCFNLLGRSFVAWVPNTGTIF